MTPKADSSRLIVLSGPSGSGKSSVLARVLASGDLPIRRSVSVTTRPPRPGEREGVDYYFWTPQQFQAAVHNGEFLEWAEIHGHHYGTLRREVERHWKDNYWVLLEIDVQGARQIRQLFPQAVMIFLQAPDLAEYERRLRQRGTEDENSLRRRLDAIHHELAEAPNYHYQLVNCDLELTAAQLRQLLLAIIFQTPREPQGGGNDA
ncbi:MAG: guanylate kinase [Gemmatales bacterium]|nr:guanylate kinase [Gemmatales bacterium]MDW7993465.1 guanylate kinase [Gemmatales bacterium]